MGSAEPQTLIKGTFSRCASGSISTLMGLNLPVKTATKSWAVANRTKLSLPMAEMPLLSVVISFRGRPLSTPPLALICSSAALMPHSMAIAEVLVLRL